MLHVPFRSISEDSPIAMWPSRNNLRVMENLGAMPKLRELKFGLLEDSQ